MLISLLAQVVQTTSPDQFDNVLQWGIAGILLAVLLIFIPSVLGFVWLVLKSQDKHITGMIASHQEGMVEMTDAIHMVAGKLDVLIDRIGYATFAPKPSNETKAKLISLINRSKKDGNNISASEAGQSFQRPMGSGPDAV